MLQNLSQEIRDCYERAAECRQRAEKALDPEIRERYSNMERRWLLLAKSHEFRNRLGDFTAEAQRHLSIFTPPHPALPRVMCPHCGKHMRLEQIEPAPSLIRRAEILSFRCECDFALQQTIDRID
jgi:hypothetical protein